MSSTSGSCCQPSPRRLLAGPDAADLAVGGVPDRDPVPPPELAADAPVVHVVDPVEVAGGQLARVDPHPAVPDRVPGRLGQRLDLDEPLQGQPRLHDRAAAAAVPDRVHVGPDLGDDPALLAQCGEDRGPGLEPVQALERARRGDDAALVHDGQAGQAVAAADLEVVRVVRRGDLDRAGAELRVHVRVGDHRDAPAGQRQLDLAADQVGVPLVVGVHRHRGVAEHGLGPGGGDHDRVGAVAVAERDQLAVGVAVVHLDVGQRGQAARAPVDDPLGPVDEAVVVKPLEDRLHRAGQALVHGEPLTGPVHAVAEPAHLAEDLPAGLGLPLPDPLHERLAAQVVPGQALLGQFPLDHVLGGDAGVVHAGQPQRVVALHPPPPDQRVHEGVVERVAHVQGPGHVRRRDHDGVRRPRARPRPRRTGPWRPTRRSGAPPPRPARTAAEAGFAGLRSRQVSLGRPAPRARPAPSRPATVTGTNGSLPAPPRWIGAGRPCEPGSRTAVIRTPAGEWSRPARGARRDPGWEVTLACDEGPPPSAAWCRTGWR